MPENGSVNENERHFIQYLSRYLSLHSNQDGHLNYILRLNAPEALVEYMSKFESKYCSQFSLMRATRET